MILITKVKEWTTDDINRLCNWDSLNGDNLFKYCEHSGFLINLNYYYLFIFLLSFIIVEVFVQFYWVVTLTMVLNSINEGLWSELKILKYRWISIITFFFHKSWFIDNFSWFRYFRNTHNTVNFHLVVFAL